MTKKLGVKENMVEHSVYVNIVMVKALNLVPCNDGFTAEMISTDRNLQKYHGSNPQERFHHVKIIDPYTYTCKPEVVLQNTRKLRIK